MFIHSLHFSRGGERSKILPQACARSIGLTIALLGSAAFAGAFPAVSSATLSFHPANNQSVGGGPNSVAVADLNRDGKPDLATANRDTNDGSVLLRGGDGPVPTANNVSVGRGALLPLSLSATPTTMASPAQRSQMRACVAWADMVLDLPWLVGFVKPDNVRSIAVLTRAGFAPADQVHLWGLDLIRYRRPREDQAMPEPSSP